MTRTTLLASLAFTTALLATPPAANAKSTRPNVLILFADDQRADTIAALGNPVIKTPNLGRLARSGLAFNRAYMQGAFGGATCVPSRAMLLSGRNLFHIDEKLNRGGTWPEAFGQAGYTTFVSGKWHNGDASLVRSFQNARSMFLGGMTNPMQARLSHVVDGKVAAPQLSPKHACEAFADETIQFLQEHQRRVGFPAFVVGDQSAGCGFATVSVPSSPVVFISRSSSASNSATFADRSRRRERRSPGMKSYDDISSSCRITPPTTCRTSSAGASRVSSARTLATPAWVNRPRDSVRR